MVHISHFRGTALAALVMMVGIRGVHAQANSNNNLTAPALSGSAASAVAVKQPGTSDSRRQATQAASSAPVGTTVPTEEGTQSVVGNVAELQQMIRGNQLTELRTAYNGSYGASLLFYAKEMTYYVVLFQQKTFWRVIKTQDEGRSEAIYGEFAQRSAQLANVELRRSKLEAQNVYTTRLIELSQARADRLQADLNIAREQQKLVDSRQKETRDDAIALQERKEQSQMELREAQRQVADLQRQNDAGLPTSRQSQSK
jgi:hypothetical protein